MGQNIEPSDPVEALDGVGAEKGEALRGIGVETVGDVAETHGARMLVRGVVGDVAVARMKKQAREGLR